MNLSASEEKGDTPKSCQSHHGIDYTWDDCLLTAADPGNKVKSEKTDASPVESAYDGEQKGDSVKYHNLLSLSEMIELIGPIIAFPWRHVFIIPFQQLFLQYREGNRKQVRREAQAFPLT